MNRGTIANFRGLGVPRISIVKMESILAVRDFEMGFPAPFGTLAGFFFCRVVKMGQWKSHMKSEDVIHGLRFYADHRKRVGRNHNSYLLLHHFFVFLVGIHSDNYAILMK